ncbi:MAG: SHOCT domain-containing protein [Candidatus Marinimicrobia bacterium]|nr:SHOCT domain-containing protein [Candidatus Neomarinimicrobiota bacterium]
MMNGGFMMGFGWLAILIIIVFGARILMGDPWGRKSQTRPDQGKKALNILKERYARGDLSESEYLDMKANLLK